jgi:hypothetical protein
LPYSAIGRRVRPRRDTTVKNNASPSQRPETATQNVASDPAVVDESYVVPGGRDRV